MFNFTDYLNFLPQNLNLLDLLVSLLFGNLCTTAIYFFSKNKWGSILMSAPISAVYLFWNTKTLFTCLSFYHRPIISIFHYLSP
jgi:hypothetical protein